MNRRLQQFLAAENISQSQFADSIGVARASVSHIISGRNKPGFDFIENMSRRFPAVNLEWLITGKGKMYKNATEAVQTDIFTSPDIFGQIEDPADTQAPISPAVETPADTITESKNRGNKPEISKSQRNITKIVVFYDDNTFQELR